MWGGVLHFSGVGRRRALQEIGDKRDATSISFRAFRFRLCLYRSGGGGGGSSLEEGPANIGPKVGLKSVPKSYKKKDRKRVSKKKLF